MAMMNGRLLGMTKVLPLGLSHFGILGRSVQACNVARMLQLTPKPQPDHVARLCRGRRRGD
jgi:hypothetical protein